MWLVYSIIAIELITFSQCVNQWLEINLQRIKKLISEINHPSRYQSIICAFDVECNRDHKISRPEPIELSGNFIKCNNYMICEYTVI